MFDFCFFSSIFRQTEKMNHKLVNGWVLLSLLMSTLVYAYPPPQSAPNHIADQYVPQNVQHRAEYQQHQYLRHQQPQPHIQHYQVHSSEQLQQQQQQQQHFQQQQQPQYRKFAEKPNALKKVSLDDIDQDIQTNQIDGNLFSWTNMLGSVMQMVFNANNAAAPTKSDDLDTGSNPASPWTNAIAIGTYFLIIEPIYFVPQLIASAFIYWFCALPKGMHQQQQQRKKPFATIKNFTLA